MVAFLPLEELDFGLAWACQVSGKVRCTVAVNTSQSGVGAFEPTCTLGALLAFGEVISLAVAAGWLLFFA